MSGRRIKQFYDLESAKQFGNEVEQIANQIVVQTGKRTSHSVIRNMHNPDEDYIEIGERRYFGRKQGDINPIGIGDHYHIEVVEAPNQNVYNVRYYISPLRGASKADKLQAHRQADEYLDQKYRELGPNLGMSRA